MTSANITFNETSFIKFMINRFYNDDSNEPCEILFDYYFKVYFPTDEICEAVRNKYYSGENYNSESLYSILLIKVQDKLLSEDEDPEFECDEMEAYDLE
jgi:hypothetical protein